MRTNRPLYQGHMWRKASFWLPPIWPLFIGLTVRDSDVSYAEYTNHRNKVVIMPVVVYIYNHFICKFNAKRLRAFTLQF